MEENKTVGKIYPAMVAIMRTVDAVGKDARNTDQNYNFRSIDAVYNMIHQAMSKHGVFCRPEVVSRTDSERLTRNGGKMIHVVQSTRYHFCAEDGSEVIIGPIFSEGMDISDKATNKALAMAHKYAILQTFCVPTEDMQESDKAGIELGGGEERPQKSSQPRLAPKGPKPPVEQKPKVQPSADQKEHAQKVRLMFNLARKGGWTDDQVKAYMKAAFQVDATSQMHIAALEAMTAVVSHHKFQHAMQEFGPPSEGDFSQSDLPTTVIPGASK